MSALVDALGRKAVQRLSSVVGGRQLRIPTMDADPSSQRARARLIALVGPDLAADLITAMAGFRVYVPRGPTAHNSRSKPIAASRVDRLTKAGWTAQRIADHLGCTPRTVYAHRAKLKAKRKPA